MKSHPVWVRGLKLDRRQDIEYASLSHPVWVRGLKQPEAPFNTVMDSMSHPVWVRGLKQQHAARYDGLHNVAPRVGAWIETTELWTVCASIYEGRTPCGCVD